MPTWIANMVIAFVVRQFVKYGLNFNWPKFKANVEHQVRDWLPAWAEDAAVDFSNSCVDILAGALGDGEDLKTVIEKFVAGDVVGGLIALKDMLVKQVNPDAAVMGHMVAAVDAMTETSKNQAAA